MLAAHLTLVSSQYCPLDTGGCTAQVNYYWDQGCTSYMEQWNDATFGECLWYNVGGAGSFNVANYYPQNAGGAFSDIEFGMCATFYTGADCTGAATTVGMVQGGGDADVGNCGNTATLEWEPVSVYLWFPENPGDCYSY